jgi:hypothetical protein
MPMPSTLDTVALTGAIAALHREKDKAYGNAWKKRGEVLGILANIARKVDRLELNQGGTQSSRDDSLHDTAVDLLVYCLKYQTYLADIDETIAQQLYGSADFGGPYSDGQRGFEYLLMNLDFMPENANPETTDSCIARIVDSFLRLERCFRGLDPATSISHRLECAKTLTALGSALITAIGLRAGDIEELVTNGARSMVSL